MSITVQQQRHCIFFYFETQLNWFSKSISQNRRESVRKTKLDDPICDLTQMAVHYLQFIRHSNIVHYLQQMCLDIALPQILQLKSVVSTLSNVDECVMCSEISSPTCTDKTALVEDCLHRGVGNRRGPASSSSPWCRSSGGRCQADNPLQRRAWRPKSCPSLNCSSALTARVCLVVKT